MDTDKHGYEKSVERGSVTRSTPASVLTFEFLRLTEPRSGIRAHPCSSVVNDGFVCF